jgi:hypothetical protein
MLKDPTSAGNFYISSGRHTGHLHSPCHRRRLLRLRYNRCGGGGGGRRQQRGRGRGFLPVRQHPLGRGWGDAPLLLRVVVLYLFVLREVVPVLHGGKDEPLPLEVRRSLLLVEEVLGPPAAAVLKMAAALFLMLVLLMVVVAALFLLLLVVVQAEFALMSFAFHL